MLYWTTLLWVLEGYVQLVMFCCIACMLLPKSNDEEAQELIARP